MGLSMENPKPSAGGAVQMYEALTGFSKCVTGFRVKGLRQSGTRTREDYEKQLKKLL